MDGWNEDKVYDLVHVCEDIYDLQYELKNCIRGCNSGAHTYKELSDYVKNLADRLLAEGEYLNNVEEDPEDEDEDDEETVED